jgi:hypothetical protein
VKRRSQEQVRITALDDFPPPNLQMESFCHNSVTPIWRDELRNVAIAIKGTAGVCQNEMLSIFRRWAWDSGVLPGPVRHHAAMKSLLPSAGDGMANTCACAIAVRLCWQAR